MFHTQKWAGMRRKLLGLICLMPVKDVVCCPIPNTVFTGNSFVISGVTSVPLCRFWERDHLYIYSGYLWCRQLVLNKHDPQVNQCSNCIWALEDGNNLDSILPKKIVWHSLFTMLKHKFYSDFQDLFKFTQLPDIAIHESQVSCRLSGAQTIRRLSKIPFP